jgi:serine protease
MAAMVARPGIRVLLAGFAAATLVTLPLPLAGAAAAQGAPDDPGFPLQWGLAAIGAPAGWSASAGTGVTIAVVDSGVDAGHEDLAGKVTEVTCIGSRGDAGACRPGGTDDAGHGTHVAGIAAATADNHRGIAGVAPGAAILSVKVLTAACAGCEAAGAAEDVAAGIRYAADHRARVINLSLGSASEALLGRDFVAAVRYAWDAGSVPVVAAGNQFVLGSEFADAPAIVVSALDREGAKAAYSNGVGEATWALAAPGGDSGDTSTSCASGGEPLGILSTYWDPSRGANQYACLAGTSMAAPHVAGAVAILLGAGLSPQRAVDRLLATADDLGSPGRDDTFGAGRVDLAKAVAGLSPRPHDPSFSRGATARLAGGSDNVPLAATALAGLFVLAAATAASWLAFHPPRASPAGRGARPDERGSGRRGEQGQERGVDPLE